LDVSLVCKFQFLEVLINLSQLICILLKSSLESLVDILLASLLFLFFEFLDSFHHPLSGLLWSFLHGHDFLLVSLILLDEELGQLLSG
jgi:hypothetical protein